MPSIRSGLLVFALVAFVPMALLLGYEALTARDHARDEAEQEARLNALLVANDLDLHLTTTEAIIDSLTPMVGYTAADIPRNDAILKALHNQLPEFFSNITVFGPDLANIGAARFPERRQEFRDRKLEYLQQVAATRGFTLSRQPQLNISGEYLVVAAAKAVYGTGGELKGVVAVTTRLNRVQQALGVAQIPTGAVVTVINDDGVIIARSEDPDAWIGKDARSSAIVAQTLTRGSGAVETTGVDGVHRLYGFTTATRAPWTVHMGIPGSIAYADANETLRERLIVGAGILALVVVTVIALTRSIASPLNQMTREVAEVGAGTRHHLSTGRGEFRPLTHAFNRTQADLAQRLAELETNNEQLRRQSEERMLAQQTLEESEARFRQFFDSSPVGIILMDPRGAPGEWEIVDLNRAACDMHGYAEDEVVGKPYDFLHAQPMLGETAETIRETLRTEGRYSGERTHRRKDGSTFPVSYVKSLIVADGKEYILGIEQDVSPQAAAEQALRQSESMLNGIIGSAMDAIIAVDSEQRIVVFNRAAEHVFGCTAAEAIGGSLDRFIPERFRGGHRRQMERFGESGSTSRSMTSLEPLAGLRADGEEFPIEAAISHLESGGQRFFTVILRDISERRRLEDELLQSQKMEAIGRLAGGVAHDFNNLLTAITGYTELALMALDEPEMVQDNLGEVRLAADRASSLTRQLLALSRRQKVEQTTFDLNTVIVDIERLLRRVIGEDVNLVTRLAPGIGLIRADRGQVEQIILNFSVNARDAMPRGGRLTIETSLSAGPPNEPPGDPPGYVVLAVSDTGHGIDPRHQARIFEPFFTTKDPGKGTGLGLSIVRDVVAQNGGRLELRSAPGEGATFRVYFPRVVATAADTASPARLAPRPGSETVLLVEDDDSLRALERQVLEHHGYRVLGHSRGNDALADAAQLTSPVHLLVTDVVMPGMSGPEVAEALVRLHPEARVLYLSGYTGEAMIDQGLDLSQVAFLSKPFTPDGLARRVREVLDAPPPPQARA